MLLRSCQSSNSEAESIMSKINSHVRNRELNELSMVSDNNTVKTKDNEGQRFFPSKSKRLEAD